MNLKLTGKIALITGSSRGIGREVAAALNAEGCKVVLNGRNRDDLSRAVSQTPGAIGIAADLTQLDAARDLVDQVVNRLGGIDILICNVGSGCSVPPGSETPKEWQRMFGINLWATTHCVEAAQPALVASTGSIVCISSICGLEVIKHAPVTYSTAKAALNAYVRGISRPLGKHGIRINAVAPGNILFEGSVWARKVDEDRVAVDAMIYEEVALRRLGSPLEVANLVTFLASPLSGFTTGQVWALDGGQCRS